MSETPVDPREEDREQEQAHVEAEAEAPAATESDLDGPDTQEMPEANKDDETDRDT